MTKTLLAIVAASAFTGGISFAQTVKLPVAPQKAGTIQLADADKDKDATPAAGKTVVDEGRECRRVIAQAADRALDGSDDLLDSVTKNDRQRIEPKITKGDEKTYKAAGDKVQEIWKKKFDGEKFNAESHVDMLGGLKPKISGEGADQTAVIHLPGAPGQQSYELRLARERNGYWRIQLPDTVDGKTFKKNMMASVNKVAADADKIPTDKAQAYQQVVVELMHEMAYPSSEPNQ